MATTIETAPAVEPITLDEAKAHSRVDITDDDALISALIVAARNHAETFTGRAIITQTWKLFLDDFPGTRGIIRMPFPPLQTPLTHIKYYDTAGDLQTFSADDYDVDYDSEPGRVIPEPNKSWPNVEILRMNTVEIQFVAGYGVAAAVPQGIKQALLLIVGHWYEHREEIIVGTGAVKLPLAAESLLIHYKIPEM